MTDPAQGDASSELRHRLRAWSVTSWRHGDRVPLTRAALARLAELAEQSDGSARPAVPDIGVHTLADQLEVLIADAADSGAHAHEIGAVIDDLADRIGLRRRPGPPGRALGR